MPASCCWPLGGRRASARSALTLPKPLVPICGHPAIAFGLRPAARAGLRRGRWSTFFTAATWCGRRWARRGSGTGHRICGRGGPPGHGRRRRQRAGAPRARAGAGHERQGGRGSGPAGAAGRACRARRRRRRCCCATIPTRSAGARSASTPTGRVVSILDARSPRPPEGRGDLADVHGRSGARPRR